jgi:hypothetical protein
MSVRFTEPDRRQTGCEQDTGRFRIRYGCEMYIEGSVRGLGSILSVDSREFATKDWSHQISQRTGTQWRVRNAHLQTGSISFGRSP